MFFVHTILYGSLTENVLSLCSAQYDALRLFGEFFQLLNAGKAVDK